MRNCALARRLERLRLLGRAADRALPPDSADVVMRLIGAELQRLGVFELSARPVDALDTVH